MFFFCRYEVGPPFDIPPWQQFQKNFVPHVEKRRGRDIPWDAGKPFSSDCREINIPFFSFTSVFKFWRPPMHTAAFSPLNLSWLKRIFSLYSGAVCAPSVRGMKSITEPYGYCLELPAYNVLKKVIILSCFDFSDDTNSIFVFLDPAMKSLM